MFRQQAQIECNCSLFNESNIAFIPFRSPPKNNNPRSQQESKISLKYSTQNQKPKFNKISLNKYNIDKKHNQLKQNCISKLKRCTSNIFIETTSSSKMMNEVKMGQQMSNKHQDRHQNMVIHHNRNILQQKVNSQVKSRVYMNMPIHSQVYRHEEYYPSPDHMQIYKEQSPSYTRMDPIKTYNSTLTTLAESMMPVKQSKKVHLDKLNQGNEQQQPYHHRQYQQSKQEYCSIQKPYSQGQDQQTYSQKADLKEEDRHKGQYTNKSSHIGMLSKLSQILNQKDEAESIYENQSDRPQENQIEYSRVLISCKKLMLQKNGILQSSLQTRLFDNQDSHNQNKSHIYHFDKIKI